MGSQNSQISYSVHQNANNWKKQASLGAFDLVKNQEGGFGQSYTVSVQNPGFQLMIYRLRHQNPEYIVTVLHASQLTQQILCATDQRIKVITERIPYRLGDIGNIGYSQGIYILQRILQAASVIQQKYLSQLLARQNIYDIEYGENMICFTDTGIAKLWINEDISLNSPKIQVKQRKRIEEDLCQNLMNLIENKMSGKKFVQYMKTRIKAQSEGKIKTLQQCLTFIKQIKQQQQLATGQTINSIVLPHMILNLGKKKQSKEFKQEPQFQYTSTIRQRIQEAKVTKDFSKLQKPPLSRKSSRSRQKSRSGSKSSRGYSSKPSQKPIKPISTPINLNNSNNTEQKKIIITQSFPSPQPLIKINSIQRKKSASQIISPVINYNLKKKQSQIPCQINLNPFKQISEPQDTKIIHLNNKAPLIVTDQDQKKINKQKQQTEGNKAYNLRRFNQSPISEIPMNKDLHYYKQKEQMNMHHNFKPKSPISVNYSRPAVIFNGHKVDNYLPQAKVQDRKIINTQSYTGKPISNFSTNSPKISFTFGAIGPQAGKDKQDNQMLRQSKTQRSEKQLFQKN